MATNVKELLAQANQAAPRIQPSEAKQNLASSEALLLEVRDANELQAVGKLKGALHVSRCMLEFRADPERQDNNPEFRKDRTVILHCASGGRSALAGKTLKDLGYTSVFNLDGFKDAVADRLRVPLTPRLSPRSSVPEPGLSETRALQDCPSQQWPRGCRR